MKNIVLFLTTILVIIFYTDTNGQIKHRYHLDDINISDTSFVFEVYLTTNEKYKHNLPILKHCRNLQKISFWGLDMENISFNFSILKFLEDLSLRSCKIKKIDDTILKAQNLQVLSMNWNMIDTLFGKLFEHPMLKELNLQSQYIKNKQLVLLLPNRANNVLSSIDFSNNELKNLNNFFDFFPNLQQLNLSSCNLNELPKSLSSLKSLKFLYISNNHLKYISNNVSFLKSLIELDLSENPLEELPENIGELTSLSRLILSKTKITKLPASIFQLKNLRLLDMRGTPIYISDEEKIKFVEKIQQAEMHPDLQIYW